MREGLKKKLPKTWQLRKDAIIKFLVTYISPHNVVGVVIDIPGQSEVTYFDESSLGHQNISSCQVSMDTLQRGNKNVFFIVMTDLRKVTLGDNNSAVSPLKSGLNIKKRSGKTFISHIISILHTQHV